VVPSGSEIVVGATGDGEWTSFCVADRGPGLPGAPPEKLFEPFSQGDGRSGRRSAGNVGLGLAVAKRIVEQHRGRIWVESQPGEGSKFLFAILKVTMGSSEKNATRKPNQDSDPNKHEGRAGAG